MTRWVALLRGINVGGRNTLPMADLRAMADRCGAQNVRSYIASGNLVFDAKGDAQALTQALTQALRAYGLEVPVLILFGDDLRKALLDCPFTPEDPRLVHVIFALQAFAVDATLQKALEIDIEHLHVDGNVAYLHTPQGFSNSKLAAQLDRVLGAPGTARNLRSVTKLVQMLDG